MPENLHFTGEEYKSRARNAKERMLKVYRFSTETVRPERINDTMQVKILTESELRQLVTIDDEAIAAIEDAFTWLAESKVSMPPIMHISVPENNGDVDIKAAYVQGLDSFAVKMGADLPDKGELYPEALGRVDFMVCDRKSQCFSMGELHHGLEAGVINEDSAIIELGEITSGLVQGRYSEDQITFCDLTGTGVQDTAVALLALRKSDEKKMGVEIDIGFD